MSANQKKPQTLYNHLPKIQRKVQGFEPLRTVSLLFGTWAGVISILLFAQTSSGSTII